MQHVLVYLLAALLAVLILVHPTTAATDGSEPVTTTASSASSKSKGVLIFSYSTNQTVSRRQIHHVHELVKSIRAHNPALPVSLYTNAINVVSVINSTLLDSVHYLKDLPISPTGREWWTRMMHLNHTPYERTLQIDPDRIVCGDLSAVFDYLEDYDVLQSSVGILPAFDNGVIAYRKTARLSAALDMWARFQVSQRHRWYDDDRLALARALQYLGISVGELSPEWNVKPMPLSPDNALSPSVSRVLTSEVKIVQGNRAKCARYNSVNNVGLPRVVVQMPGQHHKEHLAFSMEECDRLLHHDDHHQTNFTCKTHREILWPTTTAAASAAETTTTVKYPMPRAKYFELVKVTPEAVDGPDQSKGIVIMGYHPNMTRAVKYVNAITPLVDSIKRFSPHLPVTIFTNVVIPEEEMRNRYHFDGVYLLQQPLPISPTGREWWTRMLHLNHTPYDLTLQIDSDRIVCGDLSPVFDYLEHYDVLQASVGILPAFDNGVIAYRKSPQFTELLNRWAQIQTSSNLHWHGNDQPAFAEAINKTGIRCGELPPEWHAKPFPLYNRSWVQNRYFVSRVFTDEVKISTSNNPGKCFMLNKQRKSQRLLVTDLSTKREKMVYSLDECKEFTGGYACSKHSEVLWHHPVTEPIDRAQYLKLVATGGK
jgi:hypothetical protein